MERTAVKGTRGKSTAKAAKAKPKSKARAKESPVAVKSPKAKIKKVVRPKKEKAPKATKAPKVSAEDQALVDHLTDALEAAETAESDAYESDLDV